MKKCVLPALLCAVMLLCACGRAAPSGTAAEEAEASPTHSPAASGAASEVSTLDFYKDTQRLGGDALVLLGKREQQVLGAHLI